MANGTHHIPINWTALGVLFAVIVSGASFVAQWSIVKYRLDNPDSIERLQNRQERLRNRIDSQGEAVSTMSRTLNLLELKIRYIERDINTLLGNSVPGARGSGPRPDTMSFRPAHSLRNWTGEAEEP